MQSSSKKSVYLIDAYNLIYRLFYAVPPFTTKAGEPVNAVFGVAKSLIGFHEYDQPDYLYCVFDAPGKNFREDIYTEYKGTRDRMPDDLRAQEKRIFELLETMNIPVIRMEGFEADDIIGTLAKKLSENPDIQVSIVSGDKDLYQCIRPNVSVYDTMKRRNAGREEAIEKFGVPPECVVDYLAIVGDTSDNIPGISGFGPKKAQSLLGQFGSLEKIYAACEAGDESLTEKVRMVLQEQRDNAFLSKQLATIHTEVPLNFGLDTEYEFSNRVIKTQKTLELFRELEFKSLLPISEQVMQNFESVGIESRKISSHREFEELLPLLSSAPAISLATLTLQGSLSGIALSVLPKNITQPRYASGEDMITYTFESVDMSLLPCIQFILEEYDGIIVGWDMKEDIKALRRYQINAQTILGSNGVCGILEDSEEGQMNLF